MYSSTEQQLLQSSVLVKTPTLKQITMDICAVLMFMWDTLSEFVVCG